jgi:hypothetical protein
MKIGPNAQKDRVPRQAKVAVRSNFLVFSVFISCFSRFGFLL